MRAYRIAYDGQPYSGFQRQPDVPTVEDALLDALRELDVLDPGDVPPKYAAAGRTDAGVSALAQTVAFEAPSWLSPAAFNSELPAEIRAWAHAPADADFHATHHAEEREYTYFLPLQAQDEDRIRAALDTLAGDHDFHNFTSDETGARRTLNSAVSFEATHARIRLTAGGFPRQFVRRVVSLLDEIGRGEAGLERVERALAQEPLAGPEGIGPAPPEPLVLTAVRYPDLSFTPDEDARQQATEYFQGLQIDRQTGARVAETLACMGDR